jgi:hypothetical protein
MSDVHRGTCFCGAVRFEVSGNAEVMGYCHCRSCRAWSGDPIHAISIWREDRVRITAGEAFIATFHKTPESLSYRQYCSKCGGHLMIHHPALGIYDVFPETVSDLDFVPAVHVNYAEASLPLKDGLPKFRDFPSEYGEFGGTGELMEE